MRKASKFAQSNRTQQALDQEEQSSLKAFDQALYEGDTGIDWEKVTQQARAKSIQAADGQIIVGNFTLTSRGAIWSGQPSETDWQQALALTFRLESGLQWIIGDLIAFGEVAGYGDNIVIAELFGKKPQTLYNYASVCRAFSEISRRREDLTFGHHEAVAGLEDIAHREQLLDQAVSEGWSVAQLRQAVQNKALLAPDEAERQTLRIQRKRMTKIMSFLHKSRDGKLSIKDREKALGEVAAVKRWLETAEEQLLNQD